MCNFHGNLRQAQDQTRILRFREFVPLTNPQTHSAGGTRRPDDHGGSFRPLIFGEALFDHFPDGSRVLGGAPFNVAWHLRGFKADPLMVTAVGHDEDGSEILERMDSWGMERRGVQVHPTRPTGRVTAHLKGDQPRYDIEAEQAYDEVTIQGLPPLGVLEGTSLLYHGSLGLREATSAATLEYLKETLSTPVLVDVNLRDPWWSLGETRDRIQGAQWVKMNHEEAGLLSGRTVHEEKGLVGVGEELMNQLSIENLVLTLGAEGALALTGRGISRHAAPVVHDTADTVGAGDAFSAVLALGIHGGWGIDLTLQRATEFAGEVCRIRGAIPEGWGLYRIHLKRWDYAA
jgi:fructokinase